MDKLPDVLTNKQKVNKIDRLLSKIMAEKLNLIKNIKKIWVLSEADSTNPKT